MTTILIVANYEFSDDQKRFFEECRNECATKANFIFNSPAQKIVDVLCVINEPRMFCRISVPTNRVVKVVQEPSVPGSISHRFVWRHHKYFSKVVGHGHSLRRRGDSSRFEERVPFIFPQVVSGSCSEKVHLLSIVASSLALLPGHKYRNEFIRRLLIRNPSLFPHTFGRGRNPLERKEQGLDPYMFSLAIENSSIPSYVTEKFFDCILRETVPVYFGAPNIGDLFDPRCFVSLPDLSNETARNLDGKLNAQLFQEMRPFLLRAKEKYLSSNRLCCFLLDYIEASPASPRRWIRLRAGFGELRRQLGLFLGVLAFHRVFKRGQPTN